MKIKNSIINNSQQSYFPDRDELPEVAVDYVWDELLKKHNQETKELFFIIRKSQEINLVKYNGMTPIPYKLIEKKKYGRALEELKSLNIVKYSGYSIKQKKCRSYWIDWDIYKKIENMIPGRVKDYTDRNWQIYNGITRTKVRKTKNNKNKSKDDLITSEIVKDSISQIKYCVFNYIKVEKLLNSHRELYLQGKFSESEELKYLNNEMCYRNILQNGFEVETNLLKYISSYRGQKTGRRSEIGGCFQSCSREMKHEAFYSVPNVRNYDLKSSQMYGLKYAFISAGFNTKTIDRYFEIDKQEWARQIGVDKDTWKGLIYATYFGGFPVSSIKRKDYMKNVKIEQLIKCEIVRKHICKYLGINTKYNYDRKCHECENTLEQERDIKLILYKFYNQNKKLIEELQKWRNYLAKDFLNSNCIDKGNKKYIYNKSDMPIEMNKYKTKTGKISNKGKRELACHILQGIESLFISKIISYSKEENCPYKVMSDQHDGVIVEGIITPEYQERARKESGFSYACLEEKSYK